MNVQITLVSRYPCMTVLYIKVGRFELGFFLLPHFTLHFRGEKFGVSMEDTVEQDCSFDA